MADRRPAGGGQRTDGRASAPRRGRRCQVVGRREARRQLGRRFEGEVQAVLRRTRQPDVQPLGAKGRIEVVRSAPLLLMGISGRLPSDCPCKRGRDSTIPKADIPAFLPMVLVMNLMNQRSSLQRSIIVWQPLPVPLSLGEQISKVNLSFQVCT